MPVQIPQNHRQTTLVGTTKELVSLTAIVTKVDSWSETRVQGGGNHGTRHTSPVTSTVTKKDKIFAVDENGREHSWTFSNSGLDAREGHALTLVSFASKKPSPFVMVYNHNLEQWITITDGLNKGVQMSRWWLVPSWLLVLASGIGIVPLVGMFGVKLVRAHKFKGVAKTLANDFAAQEPKFPALAA